MATARCQSGLLQRGTVPEPADSDTKGRAIMTPDGKITPCLNSAWSPCAKSLPLRATTCCMRGGQRVSQTPDLQRLIPQLLPSHLTTCFRKCHLSKVESTLSTLTVCLPEYAAVAEQHARCRPAYELRHCGNEASKCSLCVPAPNVSIGLCFQSGADSKARKVIALQKCCSQSKFRKTHVLPGSDPRLQRQHSQST